MNGARLMQRLSGEELVDPLFVKTINHPTRVEIVVECCLAPISESEFRARRKGQHSRQSIRRHFEILMECGAIEVVRTERIQGGLTRYYSASKGAHFSDENFDRLPPALKGNLSAMVVKTLLDRTKESLLTGTLDSHPERHLTWRPLELDWQGFLELMERLDDIFYWLPALQEQAKERLAESGEEPIHTTAAMFGFESPPPERKNSVGS